MKYAVEISTLKMIDIEAGSEEEAIEKAKELPLELNDFDWEFQIW